MTNKEINNILKISKTPDWFKSIEVIIKMPHIEVEIPKKGINAIYQYIAKQKKGWDKLLNDSNVLPPYFTNSKNKFSEIFNNIENLINQSGDLDEHQLLIRWSPGIKQKISELQTQLLFTYDSPTTSFLLNLFTQNQNYFNGAYHYLFSTNINFRHPDEYTGAFMAYEFKFQESSNLPKRSRYEKSSNNRLRNSFEKYFTQTEAEVNEFYNATEEKVKTFDKSAIKFFKDKNIKFESWIKKTKENEADFNKYNLKRVKELENLYSDKLMLEKPAAYWESRANKLNSEAKSWLIGLFSSIAIAVVILIVVLFFISNGTLEKIFSSTGTSIKWSIGFIVLISFLAFAVKTFSKLSFSAYHLARDAEERKQLVYVYLALKQDKAVEDNERVLILQSIFSRADSGLLKEDSSPTMPASANIMNKIMAKS